MLTARKFLHGSQKKYLGESLALKSNIVKTEGTLNLDDSIETARKKILLQTHSITIVVLSPMRLRSTNT